MFHADAYPLGQVAGIGVMADLVAWRRRRCPESSARLMLMVMLHCLGVRSADRFHMPASGNIYRGAAVVGPFSPCGEQRAVIGDFLAS